MNIIPLFKVFMSSDASSNVSKVLDSGMITQSTQVEKFEKELQKWFNYPYILTLNSATSGLTLAVRLLNLSSSDVILSTPLTCFATNVSILANKNPIVWVDVNKDSCNIDLDDLKLKLTKDTKVLMFVHWGGNPLNMNKLQEIKDYAFNTFGHSLSVIEDCAHSFGATFDNKFIGTFGNIAVFSTQAIKHLTTGDGGIIFLPSKELYDRAKLLRWYGIDRSENIHSKNDVRMENDIKEWGYKFHMNDISATIGLSNLPHMKSNLEHARKIADFYRLHLCNLNTIQLCSSSHDSNPAYWLFSIKVLDDKVKFIQYLKTMGITASQVHNRNDNHSCLSEYKSYLPNLDVLETQLVCIPIGFWVSIDIAHYIVDVIREWNDVCMTSLTLPRCVEYVKLLSQLTSYEYLTDEASIKKFFYEIQKQHCTILILCHKTEIFATAKLLIENKFGQSVGHIEDVVVDVKHRHKKLGSQLIQQLVNIAKEKNCYKVVLQCTPTLTDFYTKNNFISTGTAMCRRNLT